MINKSVREMMWHHPDFMENEQASKVCLKAFERITWKQTLN